MGNSHKNLLVWNHLLNKNKCWWNSHWMVLFQKYVRQFGPSTKMAPTAELRFHPPFFLIYIIGQNRQKFKVHKNPVIYVKKLIIICLYSSNLGTFWLKIEQFWPFEEICIFSNGGHLGYCKSKWAQINCSYMARSSLTYIPGSSVKFFFQPIYTDYAN
jgi:hypothetical protein